MEDLSLEIHDQGECGMNLFPRTQTLHPSEWEEREATGHAATKWYIVPIRQISSRPKAYQVRLITGEAKGWQFTHTYEYKAIEMLVLAD